MDGLQAVRRYRRDTGQSDPSPGAGDHSSPFDAFGGCELDLIARGVARAVGAQAGLLAVSDQSGPGVQLLSAWSAADGLDPLPGSLTDGFVGRAFAFARAALVPISPHDAGVWITGSRSQLTHAVGVAVRPPGALTGALCAAFSTPPPDPAETLRLVEAYGRLASLCLEQPGLLDSVLDGARLDGLTGALNYAALGDELEREVRRSARHGLSLSCCFIDLDRFKRVNDRYGHSYGNHVLAEVAAVLRSGLRSEDTLGRYGGDEFVAILPETNETDAMALAGRLRSMIWPTIMTGSGPIDASIGVAQWQPGASSEQLLEAADRALRAAKVASGGTVVAASTLRAPTAKVAQFPVNGRLRDTRIGPAVRFCAHCGHRPPPNGNGAMRVCERCGLGILISAPADAAPGVGEPFVIADGYLTVRALSQHADTLLGVRERRAIGRELNELLVEAPTRDPDATGLEAAITRSAQGDVAFASLEVRVVNASDAQLRVRIGPCGPPPAALIVLENFS